MAEELSIDSLDGMKKADFIKAFKNKATWKKAKAVIVFVDYKLDGKKSAVAIPFRKISEMKLEMKRVKKEKTHPMKKVGGGLISMENDGEEGLKAKIELTNGGLKPEILQAKAEDLFGRINAILEVLIAADAEMEDAGEAAEAETEEPGADTDDNLLEVIENSIKEIQTAFKEQVQAIVDAIRSKNAKEDFFDIIEDITDKISDLKETFSNAGDAIKAKLKEKVDKILALVSKLAEIKNILNALFKKGETPSDLPPAVKALIELLVNKIKEAKAAKKDPKKFEAIVSIIKSTFTQLTAALKLLNKELADKVIKSKAYQFIEDFIEGLEDETDEDENGEQPEVTAEAKAEFEGTMKELEKLFAAAGIQL